MRSNQQRLGKWLFATALLGTAVVAVGCGGDDDDVMGTPGGGNPSGGGLIDAGTGPSGDGGSPVASNCPALSARTEKVIQGDITANTTWTCQELYVLKTNVFVKGGATLTIQPGTVVQGASDGALFITREGKIDAAGTKDAPVVFTSYQAEGARKRGDWKGVVLLGKASLNTPSKDSVFEGLADQPEFRYGAFNGVTDDAHDCGRIKYARIEYAGFRIATDKELNGLSLGGCGSATELDYIQIHGGNDDGIEFFGGTVNAKHLVLTGNDDDNIDWDLGWRGKVQFAIVQQHSAASSANAENGIEADNDGTSYGNQPISKPTLFNLTFIGANDGNKSRGLLLRHGTQGVIRNAIVQGFPVAAIDVRDAESAAATASGDLTVTNSLFFQNGPGGNTPFPAEAGSADNDRGFDESAFFTAAERQNRVNVDPQLGAPYSPLQPSFAPPASSPVTTGGATPPSDGFFDTAATHVGAIAPGADWTVGWTAYPPVR